MIELKAPQLLPRETPAEENLKSFPYLMSAKLDGIRCLSNSQGEAVSRTLKPIPNEFIRKEFRKYPFLAGADGELIVGSPTSQSVCRDTTSVVMSKSGEASFTYYLFDIWSSQLVYEDRYAILLDWEAKGKLPYWCQLLTHYKVENLQQMQAQEGLYVGMGYEGAVVRNPRGLYKQGRCSLKQDNAFKVKRYMDDEARIIGYECAWENTNAAEVNELGRTKRSTKAEGLVAKEELGALHVTHPEWGDFWIGSGWTQEQRINLWAIRTQLAGQYVKFKYFPVGVKDKPRHPVFITFRNIEIDG